VDNQVTEQSLITPLTGILLNLNEVPDPVFAQGMVGTGVAIDPIDNKIYAPADGSITQVHSAKHAVGLKLTNGTEMLIHVGVDTVKLKGQGFNVHVAVGDQVTKGDLLIDFDMDYLAIHAKSLITPVLFTNSDSFHLKTSTGQLIEKANEILSLKVQLQNMQDEDVSGTEYVGDTITIQNPTGMHARPAALLVQLAKKFNGQIELHLNGNKANAKSVVSIMGLEIAFGSEIAVKATGSDGQKAVTEISTFLANFKEEHAEPVQSEVKANSELEDENTLVGVCASSGVAVGTVFQVGKIDIQVEKKSADPHTEKSKLEKSISEANAQILGLKQKLEAEGNKERGAIFAAHLELLDDPDLIDEAFKIIDDHTNAEFAWKAAFTALANRFANLNNELFRARANDIMDIGNRVLKIMMGEDSTQEMNIPANSILIAENLTPSDTASLDKDKVLAFATTTGGTTSHVAILARSMGIPAIAGISTRALDLANNTEVLLDADKGIIKLNFTEAEKNAIQEKAALIEKQKKEALSHAFDTAKTIDNVTIEVAANVAGTNEAQDASELGCDGVGLMRSEFLFMDRNDAPTEDEQLASYQTILDNIHSKRPGKSVIIRTLDVGGDKPLQYLPIPAEENPFLGERGIRVSLNNLELFRTQIRALLRVKPLENVKIMFPMVSELSELLKAKEIVREEEKNLGVGEVSIGIMIEVPSAALMANTLAAHVDFFSVGANDLTQYTVAVDRGHGKLAHLNDGLNPAVLSLIKMSCDAAKKHGKWVGVCGGIASDLAAVPVLLGLGVTELSVSVPVLPLVKEQVRKLSLKECTELAEHALAASSSEDVREMVAKRIG
jgi:phosphoenolpyruvate-protein phosphotransferase